MNWHPGGLEPGGQVHPFCSRAGNKQGLQAVPTAQLDRSEQDALLQKAVLQPTPTPQASLIARRPVFAQEDTGVDGFEISPPVNADRSVNV